MKRVPTSLVPEILALVKALDTRCIGCQENLPRDGEYHQRLTMEGMELEECSNRGVGATLYNLKKAVLLVKELKL